jgi:malate/lactate dehydrogenase
VLGRQGIVRTVQIPLSQEERAKLEASAKTLKDMVAGK